MPGKISRQSAVASDPYKLPQVTAYLLNKVQALCIIHPVNGFPVYPFPDSQEQTEQSCEMKDPMSWSVGEQK